MEKIDIKELERIPIPEGLEERLSAKIDEWARPSKSPLKGDFKSSPFKGDRRGSALLLAASFILVCGIGLYFALAPTNKGTVDTYDDPETASLEAQKALQLLATNLNKGMAQYEKAVN
jgi:hypothetical protein